MPILGRAQTYVIQTVRLPNGDHVGFLQMVDAEGRARLVIPEKVMAALYRQREGLLKRAKTRTGRAKWERRRQAIAPLASDTERAERTIAGGFAKASQDDL
jgi:hypothetical protein